MEVCETFGHVLTFFRLRIIAFRRIQYEGIKLFENLIQFCRILSSLVSGFSFVDTDNGMFFPLINNPVVQCSFSMALHR